MKFYKTLNKNLKNKDFQYSLGRNEFFGEVIPNKQGLHFSTSIQHPFRYYSYNPEKVVLYEVEPEGDFLWSHGYGGVSKVLHLLREVEIEREELEHLIVENSVGGCGIYKIDHPLKSTQIKAIQKYPNNIKAIDNPDEDIQIEAINQGCPITGVNTACLIPNLTAKARKLAIERVESMSEESKATLERFGYLESLLNCKI